MSKNIIVIKSQDRGGSHFIKKELLPDFQFRDNYIYDINREYGMFKNKAVEDFKGELPDMDDFLKYIPRKTDSYANIVFEEATSMFSRSGGASKILLSHVTRRFHTQNLNVFVFHSLLKIPTDIYDYMDYLVLFRTDDDPLEVKTKFKSYKHIIEAFERIQIITEGTEFNRERKTYKDERSKQFFHYKEIIPKK